MVDNKEAYDPIRQSPRFPNPESPVAFAVNPTLAQREEAGEEFGRIGRPALYVLGAIFLGGLTAACYIQYVVPAIVDRIAGK